MSLRQFPIKIGIFAALTASFGVVLGFNIKPQPDEPPRIVRLDKPQYELGDPEKGRDYLLHGDYVGSGVPLEVWKAVNPRPARQIIEREGVDPSVPFNMNQFITGEGVEVVGGVNCLACHASWFRGEFVIGLGNSLSDWTRNQAPAGALRFLAATAFPPDTPEHTAFNRFVRGASTLDGGTQTPFRGVNPAFRIEELAAAHRNPNDLSWNESRVFEPQEQWVASDVPAWWLLKKKNALYYNAMGRGDPAALLQQIGVVMIDDKEDSKRITENMRDLVAYLYTIEPPKYPKPIDAKLAAQGEQIFTDNCMKCHGSYGPEGVYPSKLVPAEIVGTDPLYAETLARSGLKAWYNESWYTTAGAGSYAETEIAYIAPPLDGVWSTAPYFHNASVPTIEAVLDSSKRPKYWRRTFNPNDYDLDALGWIHEAMESATDTRTYDTTIQGYGAQGHTYGDDLTNEERRALIEYLKSL